MDWQPIETAPKDGTLVWLFYPVKYVADQQVAGWYARGLRDGDRWMDHADAKDDVAPTHWQPLPTPPGSDPTPAAAEARATKATEADLLEFLSQQYVLRADDRQAAMGLSYLSAEVHELANSLAQFLAASLPPPEANDGAAPSPETGWRLVPVEATEAMLDASFAATVSATPEQYMASALAQTARGSHGIKARNRWAAMLAAAPAAPSPDLAALEEIASWFEDRKSFGGAVAPRWASALRTTILHLKAQPNAGPSADGEKAGQ